MQTHIYAQYVYLGHKALLIQKVTTQCLKIIPKTQTVNSLIYSHLK